MSILRFQPVGKTEDGRLVVDNVFKALDTHGIPLDVVVDKLDQSHLVPSWYDFVSDALRAGWKGKTIRERILTAVGDVHGPDERAAVSDRLDALLDSEINKREAY